MIDAAAPHALYAPAWPDLAALRAPPCRSPDARRVRTTGGWLTIHQARHRPALRAGLALLERRPLALLGFSPGSGYFSRKRVEIAIEGMAALFDEVVVVVPDTIVEHTYRALGYPEAQVVAKARSTSRNLWNRCQKAVELARARHPATRLSLLDWATDVERHPTHAEDVEQMRALFRNNASFRASVVAKGREVLAAKRTDRPPTDAEIHEGIQYLLKEFAFVQRARAQLGREVVMPYYQDFPLVQGLCDGQYLAEDAGVGWLIYGIEIDGEEKEGGSDDA